MIPQFYSVFPYVLQLNNFTMYYEADLILLRRSMCVQSCSFEMNFVSNKFKKCSHPLDLLRTPSNMNESIRIQGSYPSLPQDESEAKHFLRMALAQVLPSDEGIQAGDAMIKLKQYAQKAAESGADGK